MTQLPLVVGRGCGLVSEGCNMLVILLNQQCNVYFS